MITRDKLDEIELIARDLRMALDYIEKMDNNEEFVLLSLADGTRISTTFGVTEKTKISQKAVELDSLLQTKLSDLRKV
jgi:hypothetical protein